MTRREKIRADLVTTRVLVFLLPCYYSTIVLFTKYCPTINLLLLIFIEDIPQSPLLQEIGLSPMRLVRRVNLR